MVTKFKDEGLTEEQINKFKEQEAKANCVDDCCELAENISREFTISAISEDNKNIYKIVEALKASIDSPDSAAAKKRFDELIDSFPEEDEYNTLHDLSEKKWNIRIYQKAERLAETYDEYKRLAMSIEGYLDNEQLLRKIYKKVERLAGTFEEYECLAKSIEDNLDDERWVEKLRKKAAELKN